MSNAQRSNYNGEEAVYDPEERLVEFSARCIRLADTLNGSMSATHVAKQLLRSATSPYANHGEVEAAESQAEFNHKISICLKELRETKCWLQLVQKVSLVESPERVTALLEENEERICIFFSSLRTRKKKLDR
ncbi:MAG: four helix bundle protein [Verrucomicrobiota bacterium]